MTHRLWIVNDALAIEAFRSDFAARKLYIADGHHRYETAINYRNYCRENAVWAPGSEFVMMMLVDMAHPGLLCVPPRTASCAACRIFRQSRCFPAARNTSTLSRFPAGTRLSCASRPTTTRAKKSFVFAAKRDGALAYTLLTLRDPAVMADFLPEKSDASRGLDVSVLHTLVLERVLGIDKENMANQKNLTYTRSADEALESVQAGESQCAFLLNPTRVEEIGAVAAAGEDAAEIDIFLPEAHHRLVMNSLEAPIED